MVCWFQVLKSQKDMMLFFIIYDKITFFKISRLNEAVLLCHVELCEIVMGIFHYCTIAG